jgi:hypothetical protein
MYRGHFLGILKVRGLHDAQRPGLWEGWEIEFLLLGLGRIFCFYTANVRKPNRITKAEGFFPNPTLPKPLLAADRNVNDG